MSIEARERGPEVAINCSALLLGVALSYWISFGFTRMTNQVSWVRSSTSGFPSQANRRCSLENAYRNSVHFLHSLWSQHVLPPGYPKMVLHP